MSGISLLAYLAPFCALIATSLCITYRQEGEVCELRDGSDGICGRSSVCESAFSIPRNPPILCTPVDGDDIICCPPEYIKKKQRKHYEDTETCSLLVDRDLIEAEESLSGKACKMYGDTLKDRSEIKHILGANKVEDMSNYPFMAALGYKSTDKKAKNPIDYRCGGILISDRFVLTAAHCDNSEGPVLVKMGSVNLTGHNPDSKEFEVEKFIAHPCYNMEESYYDIALVKLSKVVEVSSYIFPACIFKEPEPEFNKLYNISGWGATSQAGHKKSETLLEASLIVQPPDRCNFLWQPDNKTFLPRGFAENTMLCANNPVKGTCKGDSGGPLSLGNANVHFTVIGVITQGGAGCGDQNRPDIITKIYPFLLWIEDVIWPDGNVQPLQWDEGSEEDYEDDSDDDYDDDDDNCIGGSGMSC